MWSKIKKQSLTLAFYIIGVLFILYGIGTYISDFAFEQNGVRTDATIYEIKEHGEDGWKSKTAFVSYLVDNKEYKGELNYYSLNGEVGDKVEIYYDASNPLKMKHPIDDFFCFYILFGSLMIYFGYSVSKTEDEWINMGNILASSGTQVTAQVLASYPDVFKDNCYRISCRYQDPITNEEFYFQSDSITFDPAPYLKHKKEVKVYVDFKNPTQYYVVTDTLKEIEIEL